MDNDSNVKPLDPETKMGFIPILAVLRQKRYESLKQAQNKQDKSWSVTGNKKEYSFTKIILPKEESDKMGTQEPSLEEFNRVICIKIVPTSGIASYWITVSYNDISWSDISQEIKIEPQVNIQWGRIDQNSITLDNYRWTKESIKDNLYKIFYLTLSQYN